MTDLKAKVSRWLAESGFPLEMEVARVLIRDGFEVSQSAYYVDPETVQTRETDVIATMENDEEAMTIRVTAVIECKSSREAPWVIFRRIGPPLMPQSVIGFLATTRAGTPFLSRIKRRSDITTLPLFAAREYVGYGIAQAIKANPDNAYAAVMSVAKAAHAHLTRSDIPHVAEEVIEIVVPVVVTEAPLFETHLNSKGETQVEQVERSTLVWRNPKVGRSMSVVEIVSRAQYASFASQFAAAARLITKTTGEDILATSQARLGNASHRRPNEDL